MAVSVAQSARSNPHDATADGLLALYLASFTSLNAQEANLSQRLRGISDAEASGAAREIFESSNKLLGRTANLMRILAHSPHLTKWYLGFVAAVRQPDAGALSDVRLRNLAVLKTSTVNGCRY